MKIGFTGTQKGMTPLQHDMVQRLIKHLQGTVLHDGDCIGADSEAFFLAKLQGLRTVCHPPLKSAKRAFNEHDETRPPYEYLIRNHHIVDETEILIGTPKEYKEQFRGSGTWSTIRYARAPIRKRPAIIVYPDSSMQTFNYYLGEFRV